MMCLVFISVSIIVLPVVLCMVLRSGMGYVLDMLPVDPILIAPMCHEIRRHYSTTMTPMAASALLVALIALVASVASMTVAASLVLMRVAAAASVVAYSSTYFACLHNWSFRRDLCLFRRFIVQRAISPS